MGMIAIVAGATFVIQILTPVPIHGHTVQHVQPLNVTEKEDEDENYRRSVYQVHSCPTTQMRIWTKTLFNVAIVLGLFDLLYALRISLQAMIGAPIAALSRQRKISRRIRQLLPIER
mmetsp:Transcript_23273/g.55033  ORF Transcript_23273/g.55033 Transcript_23273/m.55033 type:complete len:117 (-) Transcript_23273:3301-3651(-)